MSVLLATPLQLVLATPFKTKQCMIMLMSFDLLLAGLVNPPNTKATEARPIHNFWSSAMCHQYQQLLNYFLDS